MTDHYDTLGVPRDASLDDIKAAFRRAARQAHPDMGGDAERMAAHDVLSDAAKRAEYDETGAVGSSDAFELEARDRMLALFGTIIDTQPDETDVVSAARSLVVHLQTQVQFEITAAREREVKLRKQRDRVRRKDDGPNLYVGLIDARIDAIPMQIERIERGCKVFERVAEMLGDYESAVQQLMHYGQQRRGGFYFGGDESTFNPWGSQ